MENVEIVRALEQVADLLEIQGANVFRVRAYRNAARTVGALPRPVAEMVAEGADLQELPGIGEDLSAYLVELVETGHLKLMKELEKATPASLSELVRVDGVGPKRARLLFDQLGIDSLAALRKALEAGKLDDLRGFGAKSIERIRRSLDEVEERAKRFRLADADQLVRPLLEHLRQAPGLEALEAAGSFRRRMETLGDVDLLAIAGRPAPVMRRFTGYPDAVRVEAAGTTRGTIVLRSGLHVDLRILPRRSYGAALHYFTGSKAHNIEVRRMGLERGLRISEYGIFEVKRSGGARRIGGAREADVFRAVGLPWIPPELRENRGEIEAARAGTLPRLVTDADIRGDLQVHSTWSDGRDSIEAMARACDTLGYKYMAITDHSAAVTVAGGLDPERLERQWREIAAVRRKVHGIRILRGMEVDILRDGTLDLPDEYLDRLDIVVVAVHSHRTLSRSAMTDRILRALAHPAVDILAHPTGRLIGEREPYALDVEAVLKAAAEHDVAVEIDAQPDRLDLSDILARRAHELGVRLAIDTDAHAVDQLRFMSYGVSQARRAWLEAADIVNTMEPAALDRWLRRRQGARGRRAAAAAEEAAGAGAGAETAADVPAPGPVEPALAMLAQPAPAPAATPSP
ncbi:MAG TPA: DNA polymerase/3'-5' exonuclease PolX [Longimicrobiales bacterium]|nr:DNA polymerase/3'-5' exonuclease PolX [Longimicrobiales bacterium]